MKKLLYITFIFMFVGSVFAAKVGETDVMDIVEDLTDKGKKGSDYFGYGADFQYRIRHEEHRWGREDRLADRTWARYRFRFWTKISPLDNLDINARLVSEPRHYYKPDIEKQVIWKEAFFDHLNVEWRNAFNKPLTLKIGRQDMRFGRGWMITEGTLIDGTRSRYFDAARATLKLKDKDTTIDAILINNYAYGAKYIRPFNDDHVKVSRSDVRGAVLYFVNRSLPHTKLEAYTLYEDHRKVWEKGYEGELYTIGGAVNGLITDDLEYYVEMAPQFGRRNGHNISAFGVNSLLTYRIDDALKSSWFLAYEHASGDEKSIKNFSRTWAWGKPWFGQIVNLHKFGLSYGCIPAKNFNLRLNYRLFFKDEHPENYADIGVSEDGDLRGNQFDLHLRHKISKHIWHRVQAGFFVPGDYYDETRQETATFMRWELNLKL